MIDMKIASKETEMAREFMHAQIDKSNKLTDFNVVKASQDLDQKILKDMLKQDPKIENRYLKGLIKTRDIQIKHLQNEVDLKDQKIRELVESIVMLYELGNPLERLIRIAQLIAMEEGLL